jgi:hypothetical protein
MAIVAESRRVEGYDTNGSWTPGVLVYSIDTSISTSNGPLKVLPINDLDSWKDKAPLQVGGSITVSGVTITFVSTSEGGDVVRVVRSAAAQPAVMLFAHRLPLREQLLLAIR